MLVVTRETVNSLSPLGSLVFETAIVALELPEHMSRSLLAERLERIGLKPKDLTIELLGGLMPQMDESMRLCLPQTEARSAMTRLTAFIIGWNDLPSPNPEIETTTDEDGDHDFEADWD